MRVEFSMQGGLAHFPGLSRPVAIETGQLDEREARRLRQMVEDAHFFDLPAHPPVQAIADCQYCILSIEDGGRKHTVRLAEPIHDEALESLMQAVRQYAKAARASQRSS